jgi:hypothetical protein
MTNFLLDYLDSASPAELAELQKLADLDRADDRAWPCPTWLCLTCTMKLGGREFPDDLVDDHSPPCDCCGLDPEPDALRVGECDRCSQGDRYTFRYLTRADWNAKQRGLQVLREFGPAALDDTPMPEDEAAQLLAALDRGEI